MGFVVVSFIVCLFQAFLCCFMFAFYSTVIYWSLCVLRGGVFVLVLLFACLFACLLVCLFVRLFACLFVSLFVCLLACLFACLLASLFVCLLACLFACLFVCLFACLLVCLLDEKTVVTYFIFELNCTSMHTEIMNFLMYIIINTI